MPRELAGLVSVLRVVRADAALSMALEVTASVKAHRLVASAFVDSSAELINVRGDMALVLPELIKALLGGVGRVFAHAS